MGYVIMSHLWWLFVFLYGKKKDHEFGASDRVFGSKHSEVQNLLMNSVVVSKAEDI